MAKFKVRLTHVPRDPRFPREDDALGEHLWSMLVEKLEGGPPRPALFTFFAEAVQIVDVAPLVAPLEEDLVRVEAQVEGVVAQEALGVDGSREFPVVAALQGGKVASADLRVALRPIQIDALPLARGEEPLRQAGRRLGGDRGAVVEVGTPTFGAAPCLFSGRHPVRCVLVMRAAGDAAGVVK